MEGKVRRGILTAVLEDGTDSPWMRVDESGHVGNPAASHNPERFAGTVPANLAHCVLLLSLRTEAVM